MCKYPASNIQYPTMVEKIGYWIWLLDIGSGHYLTGSKYGRRESGAATSTVAGPS